MRVSLHTWGAVGIAAVSLLVLWLFPPTHRLWLAGAGTVSQITLSVSRVVSRLTLGENELATQLESCTVDRERLTAALAEAKIAQGERDELAGLLRVADREDITGIVAHVITRALEQNAARVLIDKGGDDGLAVGQAVIVGEGFLFGSVVEVYQHTAVVRLLIHPESRVPVMTQGSREVVGIASGTSGADVQLQYVPKSSALDEGDIVVTSGRDGVYPPNIVVGIVKNIVRDERDPFYEASIQLPIDPLLYATVFVHLPSST